MCFQHTLNAQIAAEKRLSHINMFDLYLNLVDLSFRLLGAVKFATGAQEGRGGAGYQLQSYQHWTNTKGYIWHRCKHILGCWKNHSP